MRRKAGKNVTVKNRSIRARLTAVTVTPITNSSPFLWFALLFVIGVGALTVYGIAGKRKKPAPSDTGKTE